MLLGMQNQIEESVFKIARRVDAYQERKRQLVQFRVNAGTWRRRAGLPTAMVAVGDAEQSPLPSALLGLRLGTCDVRLLAQLAGHPARISVSRDEVFDGLRLTARQPEPFGQAGAWPEAEIFTRHLSIHGQWGSRRVRLANVSLSALGHDDDFDGYAAGHISSVIVGEESTTSLRWSAYLLGLDLKGVRWQGAVRGTQVSLRPIPPERRWRGLAARVREPWQSRPWSAAEWATWHRAAIPADLPMPVQADMEFPSPVTADEAERFLLEDLCWVLDLYAGRRILPAGIWDQADRCGRLTDLGRPLYGQKLSTIHHSILVGQYLDEVLPQWNGMSEDERREIKIGVAAFYAPGPDLEVAVVVGAMGLEHLASALLPPADDGYDLTKDQKRKVRDRLQDAAEEIAHDSEWARDLPRLAGKIFQRPAADRISELCEKYFVSLEEGELKAYAEVRNPVTHGRITTVPLAEKIRAMLFERHAIGVILLRRLGYHGPVYDTRGAAALRQ